MSERVCPSCGHVNGENASFCANCATPLGGPPPVDELVGKLVAQRYKVIKRLGEGGMGEVYLAEHVAIEKRIALKVLRLEYSQRQEVVARFLQEAKSASRIKHPNIVDVTDFGQIEDGRFFLALEYLEGNDLAGELQKQRFLPHDRIFQIMMQVCRALVAAHAQGIVHRDMKPENVFLNRGIEGENVKIVDFGIAQMRAAGEGGAPGQKLTKAGTIFGTPEYMAPEQAGGRDMDARVDIYAVGIILYELFTGAVPFIGETLVHTLTMQLNEPPAPLRDEHGQPFSPDLEGVILKALAKDRNQRFASMRDLATALAAVPEAGGTARFTSLPGGTRQSLPPSAMHSEGTLPNANVARAQTTSGTSSPALPDASKAPSTGLGAYVALVVGLLAIGGFGVFFLTKDNARTADPPIVATASAPATTSAAPALSAAPSAVVATAAPTIALADDKHVVVKIVTNPPGALVKKEGYQVCAEAPCELSAEPGAPLDLSAEKDGQKGTSKVLAARDLIVTIQLAKVPTGGGKAPVAPPAGKGGGNRLCSELGADGIFHDVPCR